MSLTITKLKWPNRVKVLLEITDLERGQIDINSKYYMFTCFASDKCYIIETYRFKNVRYTISVAF